MTRVIGVLWLVVLVFGFMTMSCSPNKNKEKIDEIETVEKKEETSSINEIEEKYFPQIIEIEDSLFSETYEFEKAVISFRLLDFENFDSLIALSTFVNMKMDDFSSPASLDSAIVLEFTSTENDTLFSKKAGDNYQKYSIDGIWKNQYVVSYQDWEVHERLLINKDDGKRYYLGDDFGISPSESLFATFSCSAINPFADDQLILGNLAGNNFQEIGNLKFNSAGPILGRWISDTEFVFIMGIHDMYEVKSRTPYLMTVRLKQ